MDEVEWTKGDGQNKVDLIESFAMEINTTARRTRGDGEWMQLRYGYNAISF